jgi:hypothetical protein
MGDDCLEQPVSGAIERYATLGHPVKMYNAKTPDSYEFCSKVFTRVGLAYPSSVTRLIYKALHQPKWTRELHAQLQMEIRHHEDCDFILQEVQRLYATTALASPDKISEQLLYLDEAKQQEEEESTATPPQSGISRC